MRTLFPILGFFLFAAPATAERDATAALVRLKLDDLAKAYGDPDPAGPAAIGHLKMDQTAQHIFKLDPARSYLVLAACEDLCSHLELVAADASSGAIFEDDDRDEGDQPMLEIAAGEIRSLSVKVDMSGCEKAGPCIYALGLYAQP